MTFGLGYQFGGLFVYHTSHLAFGFRPTSLLLPLVSKESSEYR